jgi:hypothetical protein
MTSPQARKGGQFERDVVSFLKANGFPHAERSYGAGRPDDVGDIDGVVSWCLELKNHKSLDLAGWSNEAETERRNGRARFAAVIFKRRSKPVSQSYVLMSLETFAAVLSEGDDAC